MPAPLLLAASNRKGSRHVFHRPGFISEGQKRLEVKTIDVSEDGFGVVASEPVNIGLPCFLTLNYAVGIKVFPQTFSCITVYCILSGVTGFRIGLEVVDISQEKRQLINQILESCFR